MVLTDCSWKEKRGRCMEGWGWEWGPQSLSRKIAMDGWLKDVGIKSNVTCQRVTLTDAPMTRLKVFKSFASSFYTTLPDIIDSTFIIKRGENNLCFLQPNVTHLYLCSLFSHFHQQNKMIIFLFFHFFFLFKTFQPTLNSSTSDRIEPIQHFPFHFSLLFLEIQMLS